MYIAEYVVETSFIEKNNTEQILFKGINPHYFHRGYGHLLRLVLSIFIDNENDSKIIIEYVQHSGKIVNVFPFADHGKNFNDRKFKAFAVYGIKNGQKVPMCLFGTETDARQYVKSLLNMKAISKKGNKEHKVYIVFHNSYKETFTPFTAITYEQMVKYIFKNIKVLQSKNKSSLSIDNK